MQDRRMRTFVVLSTLSHGGDNPRQTSNFPAYQTNPIHFKVDERSEDTSGSIVRPKNVFPTRKISTSMGEFYRYPTPHSTRSPNPRGAVTPRNCMYRFSRRLDV